MNSEVDAMEEVRRFAQSSMTEAVCKNEIDPATAVEVAPKEKNNDVCL